MRRQIRTFGLIAVVLIFSACSRQADTSLTIAAERGDVAEVRRLLAAGNVDVNRKDGSGLTALMWAARGGHTEAINALLDAGADMNARDCATNGWTALIHAIHKNHNRAARSLIDRGADVNAKAGECKEHLVESGPTALMFAAGYDNTEVVRALLEKGADPYAEWKGDTVLTNAVGGAWDVDRPTADRCPTETVKLLLEKAPKLKVQGDVWGKAAMFFAKRRGCTEVVSMLEQKKSVLGSDQKGLRLGSHYVTVAPQGDWNRVKSGKEIHHIVCEGTDLVIKNEELIVNGKSYGTLKEGDTVDVEYGRVFVNSKEVAENRTVASN